MTETRMNDFEERDAQDAQDDELIDGDQAPTEEATVDESPEAADSQSRLRKQLAEQHDKFLRLAAEYDNFRRRAVKERGEASARGQADLVRQILDPLDDLARFAHLDPAATDAATVIEGAAMVERKLHKSLGQSGLTIVNPVDQTFDPNLHEAVATEAAMSSEDDHVVARVFQVGYLFNGQLLRPARVVVKQWNG
jgi:molecular chaperone GrpE